MTEDTQVALQKMDAIAWGLFFVWVGIALLANLSWGIGLLGVGVIVLGGQAARKYLALSFEAFWVIVGVLFVLGGIWELFHVRVGLIPIVCIVAGVVLLLSALRGKQKE